MENAATFQFDISIYMNEFWFERKKSKTVKIVKKCTIYNNRKLEQNEINKIKCFSHVSSY